MKLLPQTKLYRYEIIAVFTLWIVYSLAYYFTGDIKFAVLFTFFTFAFARLFAIAFLITVAGPGLIAFAFAGLFGIAFGVASEGVVAGVGAFLIANAFAGVFAMVVSGGKDYPHSAKVFFSLLLEEASIICLFYISSHLQILTMSWN